MDAHELLRRWFLDSKTRVTAFAKAVGVSRQTVHGWLNGATPKAGYMTDIAVETSNAVPVTAWSAKAVGS